MTAGASCRFRAAGPGDATWLASRLPADRGRGQSFIGQHGNRALAAFAVAPPLEAHNPPGLAVALHVEPDGPPAVGMQMIALCREMARRMNLGPLYTWPHPVEGTPSARLYAAVGFKPFDSLTTYDMEIGEMACRLMPLQRRVAGQGDRLDIVPLRRADPEEVLGVWERQLGHRGGLRAASRQRITGEADRAFDPSLSRVALRDGRAMGILLATRCDQSVDAEVFALDTEARAFGAAVCLLGAAVSAAHGLERVRWQALSHVHFTHHLAKRVKAMPLSRQLLMRCTD